MGIPIARLLESAVERLVHLRALSALIMKSPAKRNESGSSIVLAISILATLMVITGIAIEYTTTISRNVQRSNVLQNAIAVGDGTADFMFGYWREVCRTQPNLPMVTDNFAAIPLPTSTQFPNIPNFSTKRGISGFLNGSANDELDTSRTISNFKIVSVDPLLNDYPATNASPTPGIGQQVTTAAYNYIAAVDVTLPALRGNITTKMRRVFQKQQMSPWNYAIFYVDPLEIHPGPQLTITGWVHTNSDLYTAHNTLTFADKVTYGHDWNIAFMAGDGDHPGETPQSPNYPSNLPPAMDVAKQPFGLDATRIFSTTDTNPNNDSYHELIEQAVAGYTDPLAGQRYYDQAGVKVLIDGTNNVTIKNSSGTTVTSSSSGNNLAIYNMINGALTTNQSIQDNREQASVRLVTLDISRMITSGAFKATFNGVVYVADTSASSTIHRAIRIKNGNYIPSGGLTIASANPVYIQGDFNTGNGAPPSNSGDPANPTISDYSKQPCSVITDAVSILSNAWVDGNSSASLSSRVASNTTVNTAIVSGIVQTAGGDYSGGAENFPRFLENWTNKTFTYYGSMVELYQSKQATGIWGQANVYNPPIREWYFDKGFYTYSPPGSLMLYSYVKGKWSIVQ